MIPEMIAELRRISGVDTRIIAVDASEPVIGQRYADTFYRVPAGKDSDYCDAVLEICRAERVDIVIPLSDEEALSLAGARERFRAMGTNILGSSWETTKCAGNKISFLTQMKAAGQSTPQFASVASLAEFDTALETLNFPSAPIVCKPADQRGGRGFRVIRHDVDELSEIFGSRREIAISHRRLRMLLVDTAVFPVLMLMEYLEGAHFSVDVHIADGKVRSAVAQKKFLADDLCSTGTEIFEDTRIDAVVESVASCFEFDHLINIDMAEQRPDGPVLPFEVNVRPSAIITGASVNGRSLLSDAVCHATGISLGSPLHPALERRQFIGACFA